MTCLRIVSPLAMASLAMLGVASCSGSGDDNPTCQTGKCDDIPDDEVTPSPCDGILEDKSGSGHERVAGRLNDPFAKLALMTGDSCPSSYAEIMDKLRENDSCGGDGIRTRVVSETAQLMDQPTNYRLVTTKECGDRDEHEIMFSLFGVAAGAAALPSNVEIIAFDKTAKVFNYYAIEPDGFKFFGSSLDFLEGPGQGEVRRCAQCHTGGGLVMKELNSPWVHWEPDITTPGSNELVDAHENLGSESNGINLESNVKAGNRAWNETRVAHLKENGSVADLLRPLFCTVEVNIDSATSSKSPPEGGPGGSEISRVPLESMLDPQLKGFGSIPVEFADYDALIKANGQSVAGIDGKIDTVVDYVFVERSFSDDDYVDELVSAGIVDEDFVKDALMVDFTRPIFSDDRCGLVTFAPELSAEDRNADAIRAGFIASLESAGPVAGSPAADFLENLKAEGDGASHDEAVNAFVAACEGLPSADFLENALTITSLNRDKARALPVFEFPATMPDDNLQVDPASRLHPTTCEVTTEFVAIATEGTGGNDDDAGPDAGPGSMTDAGSGGGVCAHSECVEGAALESSCSSCAMTVCAEDDFCCTNEWDDVCVGKAQDLCGATCQ